MAEQMGEMGPQGAQRLLNAARWDADAVRDDVREYVIEHLGDEQSGVLIVDESGFLKKGEKSVGVARQYTGTAGRIENAQVGVFLAYTSEDGSAFVDRAFNLPREEWVEDAARREEAGVPEEVRFATKGELAKELLKRAFEADVPARWVVADRWWPTPSTERREAYEGGCKSGDDGTCRRCPLPRASTTTEANGRRARLPRVCRKEHGSEPPPGGVARERLYDWACVALPELDTAEAGRWLLALGATSVILPSWPMDRRRRPPRNWFGWRAADGP